MASINNLVSYELKGVKESFANWISNLSPTDTPFVSMTGKESITNKFFQWQEDQLGAFGLNAVAEGSDADNATLTPTAVKHNVTQILRKVVQVSDTANALSSYGRGKEMQYQLEKAGKEIKRDLEWAFLNNGNAVEGTGAYKANTSQIGNTATHATLEKAYNGSPISTATDAINGARRTAGFMGLVAPIGAHSPEDLNAVVHTSGDLTESNLFKLTEGLYLAGACPDIIMFHPSHAKFFSGLMENSTGNGFGSRIRMFDGAADMRVNTYVSTLVDPLGCTFKLIPNRFMPIDRIYVFRASDWTQMVLRAPQTQLLAKTGSFDKYMIEMEVGLRHKNQFASGILEIASAPPKPTIISGTPPADFKVGDTDVKLDTLFTVTGATIADFDFVSGTTANVTVVGNKTPNAAVHAVKVGTSVITATHITDPTVTATITITVKAPPAPVLKTIKLTGTPALAGDATAGYTVGGIKTDGSTNVVVTIATDTEAGAALPANSAITVVPTDATNTAKLETLAVTGTTTRTFTVKSKQTSGVAAGAVEFTVTAGSAAPVKLTVTFAA